MVIKNLEQAIDLFKEIALVHISSQYDGDSKLVNKTYKQLDKIIDYIKLNNGFNKLIPLLNDQDDKIKFSSAIELLNTEYRELALGLLKHLSESNSKMANKSYYALIADKEDDI